MWGRADAWFDYYLMQGQVDELASMSPIIFNTLSTNNSLDSFASFDQVTSKFLSFSLGAREQLSPYYRPRETADEASASSFSSKEEEAAAALAGSAAAEAGRRGKEIVTITTGNHTNINGGIAVLTATLREFMDEVQLHSLVCVCVWVCECVCVCVFTLFYIILHSLITTINTTHTPAC